MPIFIKTILKFIAVSSLINKPYLETHPNEMTMEILEFLENKDKFQFMCTCKSHGHIVQSWVKKHLIPKFILREATGKLIYLPDEISRQNLPWLFKIENPETSLASSEKREPHYLEALASIHEMNLSNILTIIEENHLINKDCESIRNFWIKQYVAVFYLEQLFLSVHFEVINDFASNLTGLRSGSFRHVWISNLTQTHHNHAIFRTSFLNTIPTLPSIWWQYYQHINDTLEKYAKTLISQEFGYLWYLKSGSETYVYRACEKLALLQFIRLGAIEGRSCFIKDLYAQIHKINIDYQLVEDSILENSSSDNLDDFIESEQKLKTSFLRPMAFHLKRIQKKIESNKSQR